jgi:uncharacterized protein YbjT (DUF2867 family)
MSRTIIVIAGAAGDLGSRIAKAVLARGESVRALLRPDADVAARDRISALGADMTVADARDVASVATACAGVPRFISSDFSADYTKTPPGRNRNFDLRREFMGRADRAPIRVTSILNGAFMELLDGDMPLVQARVRRVLFDADQRLDFTTKDDVAAYTAASAIDATTPRILRIAGDTLSVRDMARALSETTGSTYRPLRAGSVASMSALIGVTKKLAPGGDAVFPAWQGMQYTRDMFDGRVQLEPLDNDRYPDLTWTSVRDRFANSPAFAAPLRSM